MSDYRQLQIIVVVSNRNDNNDDPITMIRNIAINENADRREIKKIIERVIYQIEDELCCHYWQY